MTNKIKTFIRVVKLVKNYPLYIADYLGLIKNKDITYMLRNGIRYKMRAGTTDRFVLNEILIHNSYTHQGFDIKYGDIVFDIGGHIGVFSIFASKRVGNGKVYSFEPVSENFELLKKNKELNQASNLKVYNNAITSKDGFREMFISKTANKGNNSFLVSKRETEKRNVLCLGFDKFIRNEKIKRIDFLKMDCEGAEYEILFDLPSSSLKKIKKISMEYHNIDGERNGKALKDFLEESGYQVRMSREKRKGRIYAALLE